MQADPPTTLPAGLRALSVSSVSLYLKCPERWRRRYIEGEYEPSSPALVLGHAVGRAEGQSFQHQIDSGSRLLVADVLDAFSDEFELKVEEDTPRGLDWEDDRPGKIKDQGARVLGLFHRTVAPRIRPAAVEQRFEVTLPGVDWTFTGYRDVDELGGAIDDFKVRSPSKGCVSAEEAAADLQPTGYLFARRAEAANPHAPKFLKPPGYFRYLNLVRPTAELAPKHVLVTPTTRSEEQLDSFLGLLYRVAAEIHWRVEADVWTGAPPGAWWCGERWCGFWRTCPFGGAHRAARLPAPAPVVRPRQEQVIDAIKATTRRDGTTTAARVGTHLGVSARSAAGSMTGLGRNGLVASAAPNGKSRSKSRSKVYRLLDDGTLEDRLRASLKQTAPQKEGSNDHSHAHA